MSTHAFLLVVVDEIGADWDSSRILIDDYKNPGIVGAVGDELLYLHGEVRLQTGNDLAMICSCQASPLSRIKRSKFPLGSQFSDYFISFFTSCNFQVRIV